MNADKIFKQIVENRKGFDLCEVREVIDKEGLVRYLDNEFKRIMRRLIYHNFTLRLFCYNLKPYMNSMRNGASHIKETINEIFERDTPKESKWKFLISSIDCLVEHGSYLYRVEITLCLRNL